MNVTTQRRYTDLKSLLALVGNTATFGFEADRVTEPNYRNAAGETPLSVVITWKDLTAVKMLIAAGADVNAIMWHGETPLHEAIIQHAAEIARYLLEHGASPDAVDDLGMTPMDFAKSSKDPAIVQLYWDWESDSPSRQNRSDSTERD